MKHTIIFLIPLLLLFSQVAYATNESSYKWGYQQGKSEFANCDDFDADCTAVPDDCQPTVYESTNGDFNGIPVSPASISVLWHGGWGWHHGWW